MVVTVAIMMMIIPMVSMMVVLAVVVVVVARRVTVVIMAVVPRVIALGIPARLTMLQPTLFQQSLLQHHAVVLRQGSNRATGLDDQAELGEEVFKRQLEASPGKCKYHIAFKLG